MFFKDQSPAEVERCADSGRDEQCDKRIPISSQTGTRDRHGMGYKVMDGRLCSSSGLDHVQSSLQVRLYFNNEGVVYLESIKYYKF